MIELNRINVMLFTLSATAFAVEPQNDQKTPDECNEGYVYVTDDEGNVYALWVEEKTYYPNNPLRCATRSSGDHELGEIKEVSVKIPNSKICVTAAAGDFLTAASAAKLSTLAATAITKKIGSCMLGVGLAAAIFELIGAVNYDYGNEGFEITATFEWSHFVNHKEGLDEYDWSFEDLDVDTY